MSWSINQGPSFNVIRPGDSYNQLTGFTQRFLLSQDSNLRTPGKSQPNLPAETVKGSTKDKRRKKMSKKMEKSKNLIMPKDTLAPEPIYGGFGKSIISKVKKKVVKSKPKKRKYRVK